MNKKKKKNSENMIKKILNTPKTLIIFLIFIIMILLVFTNHLMKTNKTYMFSGSSDYVTVLNGVISLSHDVNLISGSDVEYINEEDVMVTSYNIGYYVLKDNTLIPLVIKTGHDEEGFSLKGLINEMSAYNISEPYRNKAFFTKDILNNLESGLYFMIEGKTIDDEEILDKIELNLTKMSK